MKQTIIIFIAVFAAISITQLLLNKELNESKKEEIEIKGINNNMILKINNENVNAIFYDTETVKDLYEILPVKGKMIKLNNNEFYINLDKELKVSGQKVNEIKKGDIMLYNNDCLVIFYESFTSEYKYTKLGNILLENKVNELKDADKVVINLEKREK